MSNVNYDKYLDMLMRNYPLQSDSEDPIQSGGLAKNDGTVPFGGFPPIFMCSKISKVDEVENKNREYSTHKTAVSIKDIMQRRRNVIPFIHS
jgi:hypothetical protein